MKVNEFIGVIGSVPKSLLIVVNEGFYKVSLRDIISIDEIKNSVKNHHIEYADVSNVLWENDQLLLSVSIPECDENSRYSRHLEWARNSIRDLTNRDGMDIIKAIETVCGPNPDNFQNSLKNLLRTVVTVTKNECY